MAKKVALLVGVGNYQKGLSALPSAIKDAREMKQVLQHPDMGGFAEATILLNPNKGLMESTIHKLFHQRNSDDLVLFYFSGHGAKDETGNLFIATPTTETDQRKIVLRHTAIDTSSIKQQMNDCSSRRQVVILDCCFSGAFLAKGLILGNKSWAVLTSSDTVEYSYAPEPSELSIYTRYLVEGIKTGVADLNHDGNISVDELYEYTKKKVQEASPKMNPLFDNGRAGHKIVLAKSPKDDPKLKYRKKVEEIARQEECKFTSFNRIYEGNITENFHLIYLDDLRKSLNLTKDDAKAIETEVLEPYCLQKNKLNSYGKVFAEAIKQGYPLSQQNRQMLKDLQQVKNLRDEDIQSIEKRILASSPTSPINNQPPKTTIGDIRGANPPQNSQPTEPNKIQAASNPSSGNKNLGTIKPPISKYTKLRELLAAKKWKEADKETANVMLEAYNRESSGYLSAEDNIKKLPTEVLQTINQLWVKHSGGHFGFSIQKKIYLEVSKDYDKLGDRLGWKKEGKWLHWRELNFREQAPKGHLPSGICPLGTVEGSIWDGSYAVSVLLSRSDL